MDEVLSTTTSSDAVPGSTLRSCLIRVVPLLVSSKARARSDSIPLCSFTSSTWPDTMFGTGRRASSFSATNYGPNMLPMVKKVLTVTSEFGDVNIIILVVVHRSRAYGHSWFDVSGDGRRSLLSMLQTLGTFAFVSSSISFVARQPEHCCGSPHPHRAALTCMFAVSAQCMLVCMCRVATEVYVKLNAVLHIHFETNPVEVLLRFVSCTNSLAHRQLGTSRMVLLSLSQFVPLWQPSLADGTPEAARHHTQDPKEWPSVSVGNRVLGNLDVRVLLRRSFIYMLRGCSPRVLGELEMSEATAAAIGISWLT